MKYISLVLLRFLSLLLLAGCQDTGLFINPPELPQDHLADPSSNPIYAAGSYLNITWITTLPLVNLVIRQSSSNSENMAISMFQYLPNSSQTHSFRNVFNYQSFLASLQSTWYNWEIETNGENGPFFDLTNGNILQFGLFTSGDASNFVASI
jgi:hypothetical protein